ncbi:hypothetical protein Pint_09801 [Pistacia integerrima]|uniref:Uncharacterized protein n=1 Tax=Pistacia integerrima TaxID=434235 RepID=A0ACC0XHT5_9ROSI|nr:hypothetical protein Pint_09801 [Pistacia integerrima]
MATLEDIAVSAALNILTTFIMLIAFAILRIQPLNKRVYFSKRYRKGRKSPKHEGTSVRKFVNLDCRSYIRFLNWIPAALKMTEPELIDHAGLDSAVYLRIYLMGLKIFVPIAVLACAVLAPVNFTNSTLGKNIELRNVTSSNIDKLSTSNIPPKSERFWAHIALAYVFTFWTCYVLMEEYGKIASMRSQFIATGRPSAPSIYSPCSGMSPRTGQIWSEVMSYGMFNTRVDAIDYHASEIEKLSGKIDEERKGVVNDPQSIMPAAFVSFKTRWGAAVCAQTQQTTNPTEWLPEWAPEPRDVYWKNLAIPYVSLRIRRLIIGVAFFFLTLFFMIPIAFVQSLASIEGIANVAPFLKPVVGNFIKSVIQGFLPGVVLKLFLIFLRKILTSMSKFEGFVSLSSLQRRTASRYYLFNFVNVFLGSIITGSAFEQLNSFIKEPANDIPKTIGVAIPIKATFFITYIMVDGWLLLFYFPFIIVFFALAYVVFRHQVINVYNQKYESGAAFWPDVHKRVIAALVMSQLLLMGLLSTKEAAQSTPFLIALPVLTIWFHRHTSHPVFKTDDEDEGEDEDEYALWKQGKRKHFSPQTKPIPQKDTIAQRN